MVTNTSELNRTSKTISGLLKIIGEPARVLILFALANESACVCHLETALQMRQASISQHLMSLRKAGIVCTQREGRHIFYRLDEPGVIPLLSQAALQAGVSPGAIQALSNSPVLGCPCPKCSPTLEAGLVCKKVVDKSVSG